MEGAELYPLGDAALLFEWPDGEQVSPADIAGMAARIRGMAVAGVKELVPAYRTLAVHLDLEGLARAGAPGGLPEAIGSLAERLQGEFARGTEEGASYRSSRHVRLPVVYGGTDGPDLDACAGRSGLTPENFVHAHSSVVYEVAMIGFAPGFPYLSGLPEPLTQPRHESPRLRVPAGSVGIAGAQTGVYSVESPGGWQIVGRTAVPLFSPDLERPFLLACGDRVSFVPVEVHEEREDGHSRKKSANPGDAAAVLEVIKPGLLTTVQDRGRNGWQAYGVSGGGAMDPVSMRTANTLVGNPEHAAVLEMTLTGASFRVERELLVAFCGADMDARLDGAALPRNRPVWLRAGTMLTFGSAGAGCRTYLAVAGGIAVPAALGSRSTDTRATIGGIGGRTLAAGDRIPAGDRPPLAARLAEMLRDSAERESGNWASVPWSAQPLAGSAGVRGGGVTVLRVVEGAEWESFGPKGLRILLEATFRVETSSDRMGVRLSGPPVMRGLQAELSSHGVAPGTIQVPPDGRPIILGAGCQPTGGYAKIAHVIGADLPLLAQSPPGALLKFELTGLEDAWQAWQARERNLRILEAGIRRKGAGASWGGNGTESI